MLRKAVVAGFFYPKDKNKLIWQLNNFFSKTKVLTTAKSLSFLLVPHAGYEYSGQTAAWGFKQLESQFERKKKGELKIILVGVSHRHWFKKIAVYNRGSWETPLGKVPIEEKLAKNLIVGSNFLEANLLVHQDEHSLEVQLPFLQHILGEFKFVPILLSQVDKAVLKELAAAIARNFDERTFLVISTDLAHYPSFELANKVDRTTIELILKGKIDKFTLWVEQSERGEIEGVETAACGKSAVILGLRLAKILNIDEIKLLHYENSGKVTGDYARVVGYAAIGFYKNDQ